MLPDSSLMISPCSQVHSCFQLLAFGTWLDLMILCKSHLSWVRIQALVLPISRYGIAHACNMALGVVFDIFVSVSASMKYRRNRIPPTLG